MEWGPHRKRLEDVETESGETPTALLNQPKLVLASHAMLFQCFMTLHMMRSWNGFGPNPITMGMIRDYLGLFGDIPVDRDLLVRLLKQCDDAAMEHMVSKRKTESKS